METNNDIPQEKGSGTWILVLGILVVILLLVFIKLVFFPDLN